MRQHAPWVSSVALAAALAPLAGCLCFEGLEAARCETNDDCSGGRLCSSISTGERFCVAPGGESDAAPIPCDDPGDCDDGNACTADECASGGCSSLPAADGTPCDDGFGCTVDACAAGTCGATRSETACAGGEVCNPVAYPAVPSGCGPAPASLSLTCPNAESDPAATETCTVDLGLAGESGRLTCTATPRPLVLFEDDFELGFGQWVQIGAGAPESTSFGGGQGAAAQTSPGFTIGVDLAVTGLDVVCVDFAAGQEATANAGESITWWSSLDGGVLAPFWQFDFALWQSSGVMFPFNRNACVSVSGASTLHLELQLARDDKRVYVDDVRITGLAAPLGFTPPLSAADDFTTLAGWTTPVVTAGGPALASLGGNSVLAGELDDYEIERIVDTTGCDVVDVDFDFGFDTPDNDEAVTLSWSLDGTTFSPLEVVNLGDTVPLWDPDQSPLPWFGLRRLTDLAPPWVVGVADVWFRVHVLATGSNRFVYVDEFAARCSDLPSPAVGPPTDRGDGTYTVTLTAGAVIADLTCRWQSANDGPFSEAATVVFNP